MSPFDIEDQIQKALQDGKFDNLRGQGKPFAHLDTDALEQLVREQGFRPHFVELDAEIRAKTEIARQAVRRTYEWVMQARGGGSVDRITRGTNGIRRCASSISGWRNQQTHPDVQSRTAGSAAAQAKVSLKREEELQMGLAALLD
jgi:hypothetical protein